MGKRSVISVRMLVAVVFAALTAVLVPHWLVVSRAQEQAKPASVRDPAASVNPFIGTANGGNTFPGAVVPFGMLQWSPENTRGDHTRVAAPGGYQYDVTRIRGFSLTHLSGTGCRGASGDVPFMPYVGTVSSSPSADTADRIYASNFAHANEQASPGFYRVRLASGVKVELTATARTGLGRFTFPAGHPATMLIRVSDSEVGSSSAHVTIDPTAHTVTGSVTSGNFCGYINPIDRRSYYTLHFVAVFDQSFAHFGVWRDGNVRAGATTAQGGTTYGDDGYPAPGRGSGAYVELEGSAGRTLTVRVGISYVSLANAEANLRAEQPAGTTFDIVRAHARQAWNSALSRIEIDGGTPDERTVFYTALYHALLQPTLFSDVNGEYWGLDQQAHTVSGDQRAEYANFSGWDVYRSQLQLVTLLAPTVASDFAQSLLNQADQNHGDWDRWTHNSGATHVMEGDPSPSAIAGICAFGATAFDVKAAFASLARAATVPTQADLSSVGCPVECAGQRPSLDRWLTIHYIPTRAHAWGGAGETLEDAIADFSLSELARRLGETTQARMFRQRSGYWKNLFGPAGYIQDRNADGTWPALDPASSRGFAEGSSAQYTWMVPFDPAGLFAAMGGVDKAVKRLDAFFHNPDGTWALTGLGGMHPELSNEPSTGSPWLYDEAGRPAQTEATVRAAMNQLWSNAPYGMPGNDDLGAMSAWYVWAAMGMYPAVPGRAELLLASPLFPRIAIQRPGGVTMVVSAPGAAANVPYVTALHVDGQVWTRPWLPASFVARGGTLVYTLSAEPDGIWGRSAADRPPSFPPQS